MNHQEYAMQAISEPPQNVGPIRDGEEKIKVKVLACSANS